MVRDITVILACAGWTPLHSKVNGIANESTIDILYQLGMTVDEGTHVRWVLDAAVKAGFHE